MQQPHDIIFSYHILAAKFGNINNNQWSRTVPSNITDIIILGKKQNDNAPNNSLYIADNSFCQKWHVNEATTCKIKYHRNAQNALSLSEINKQSLCSSMQVIFKENNHFHTESCAGTLR